MESSREEQISQQMRLGIEAYQQGEFDQAIIHFKATLALEPMAEDKASCYQNLAGVYCTNGDLEEGIRCFETALTFDSDNSEILGNLGLALKKSGDNERALTILTRAPANDPYNVPARLTTAQVLRGLGKFREARVQYEAVVAAGNHEQAMMIAINDLKTLDEAAEEARNENELSAKVVSEGSFQHFANMGADAFNSGDYSDSIVHFQAALARDPQPVTKKAALLQDLGVAYLSVGNSKGGISLLKEALELDPDNADILQNYATALSRSGDTKKAEAIIFKAFSARVREKAELITADIDANPGAAPEAVLESLDHGTVAPPTDSEIEARCKSAGKALLKEASKHLDQMSPNESKIVLAEVDRRNLGNLVSEETRTRVVLGETRPDKNSDGQLRRTFWAFE